MLKLSARITETTKHFAAVQMAIDGKNQDTVLVSIEHAEELVGLLNMATELRDAVRLRPKSEDFYACISELENKLECTDATARRNARNAEESMQRLRELLQATELWLFDKLDEFRPKPKGPTP